MVVAKLRRGRVGMPADPHQLNVSITRGRDALIVIGDSTVTDEADDKGNLDVDENELQAELDSDGQGSSDDIDEVFNETTHAVPMLSNAAPEKKAYGRLKKPMAWFLENGAYSTEADQNPQPFAQISKPKCRRCGEEGHRIRK